MRVHFHQAPMGLEIYMVEDQDNVTSVLRVREITESGAIVVELVHVPEGEVVPPSMVLGYPYAHAFEEGFKRFLGERDHIVPEKVYEREAGRVDKLLDALIAPPIITRTVDEY
jgi:hypothetical protein